VEETEVGKMNFLYFIYGLAFFSMGVVILTAVPKVSRFRIAKALPDLGRFGIFYGISEWLSVYSTPAVVFVYFISMIYSLARLYYFGVKLVRMEYGSSRYFRLMSIIPPLIWSAGFLIFVFSGGAEMFVRGELWGRIILGFTGSALAFWGFIKEAKVFERQNLRVFSTAARGAGSALLLNGVFSGLFYGHPGLNKTFILAGLFRRSLGSWIEIVRVLVAILIGYFILRMLKLFSWERKRLEEMYRKKIEKENIFFEKLFEALLDPIFVLKWSGEIKYMNEIMADLIGTPKGKIIGRQVDEFIKKNEKGELYWGRFAEELKDKKTMKEVEMDILTASGAAIPTLSNICVFPAGDGCILTCHDLRPVRKLMGLLERLNAELEEKVSERTGELEKARGELQERVDDLERWRKVSVGREERMIELKEKIRELEGNTDGEKEQS